MPGRRCRRYALAVACAAIAVAAAACRDGAGDAPTPASTEEGATLEARRIFTCEAPIDPLSAAIGEQQTVLGTVIGTSITQDERGRSVILELGAEGGSAPFAVAIPESEASAFPEPPEETYAGREICVTGTVIEYRGVPTIFVTTPAEISERPAVAP